jgi:hypothetical protein
MNGVGAPGVFTNLVTGHQIGTYTNGAGTVYTVNETTTTLVLNVDGTHTYTNEAGVTTVLAAVNNKPTYGTVLPVTPPGPLESNFYVYTSTNPDALFWYNPLLGGWNITGDGNITSATVDGTTDILTLTKSIGPSVTVDLTPIIAKIDPCTAVVATLAQTSAMTGDEKFVTCIGGVVASVTICNMLTSIPLSAVKMGA